MPQAIVADVVIDHSQIPQLLQQRQMLQTAICDSRSIELQCRETGRLLKMQQAVIADEFLNQTQNAELGQLLQAVAQILQPLVRNVVPHKFQRSETLKMLEPHKIRIDNLVAFQTDLRNR